MLEAFGTSALWGGTGCHKVMQTTDLTSTPLFSSVAAWEYGTLINTEKKKTKHKPPKKGLFFQSNSTTTESKTWPRLLVAALRWTAALTCLSRVTIICCNGTILLFKSRVTVLWDLEKLLSLWLQTLLLQGQASVENEWTHVNGQRQGMGSSRHNEFAMFIWMYLYI